MRKTSIEIPINEWIDYSSTYGFLGSCFSEHLSQKMVEAGFKVESNPLGVVFNPISLADFILKSEEEIADSTFMRNDEALSWIANSTFFDYDEEKLKSRLILVRQKFIQDISTSKILFVTFGTAKVYEKVSTQETVANCHKQSQDNFTNRILSVKEIVEAWEKVINKLSILSQMYGKEIKIVFTVSPVRHIKDGIIDNSRSKATLLTAVHQLKEQFSNVDYFPSYEIMIDELRDYAYYEKDGIHPNEIAIQEIWEKFQATYFTPKTQQIFDEYSKLQQFLNHRLIHPESEESKKLVLEKERRLEEFREKYPMVKL